MISHALKALAFNCSKQELATVDTAAEPLMTGHRSSSCTRLFRVYLQGGWHSYSEHHLQSTPQKHPGGVLTWIKADFQPDLQFLTVPALSTSGILVRSELLSHRSLPLKTMVLWVTPSFNQLGEI